MEAAGWYIKPWISKVQRQQNQNGIPIPNYLAQILIVWVKTIRPYLLKK